MVVLITGGSGQLGQSLQYIAPKYSDIEFVFCSSSDLDISNIENCRAIFLKIKPHYCINAAAYTAVDKAEKELESANLINVIGAKNLAEICKENETVLLHISTDFVFDGKQKTPYSETDLPNPTGVYGQTKLEGEIEIQKILKKYYIIRTSWVYSKFGNNFMKTMLHLASERNTISVVNDQIGTPTNAVDLAEALIKIINFNSQHPTNNNYGIYNFSNKGQCSWFEFAQKIFEFNNISINLLPIGTLDYPTPAQRPKFSVLDKSKIINGFGTEIVDWQTSLKKTTNTLL
jgi:dTDP-4-dehydrorhamnose reductase